MIQERDAPGEVKPVEGTELYSRGRELALRTALALSFLALVHVHYINADLGGKISFLPLYVLFACYLTFALAAYAFLVRVGGGHRLRRFSALVDIAALCVAVRYSGGVQGYTFLFLGIAPFIGGLYGGYRGALLAALTASLGYGLVVVFDGDIPPGYDLSRALALRYGYLAGMALIFAYVLDIVLEDRRRLRVFNDISQSSSRSPAFHHVLNEITQRVANIMQAEIAVVFTYDEHNDCLVAQQPAPGIDYQVAAQLKIPLGGSTMMSTVLHGHKPILLSRRVCREIDTSFLLPGGCILDLIACPLEARGKSIGVLVLANKLSRRGFARRDLELAGLLAPQISVFLDNALLFRRSEEKVAQLTSIIRVVDAINTTSSLDQLYNLALDVIRGLFAADKALINLLDPQTGMMEAARSFGFSKQYVEKHLSHPFERIQGCFVLEHDEIFISGNIAVDRRCPNMVVGSDVRSVLCVPIRSGQTVFGILHMSSRYEDAFDDEDIALAKAIGEQIGMAVERAKLFEEINQLAITDDLTGLYNSRHLKRVLGEESKRSIRYGRSFSFIMLDIDFFKIYNDRHGHLRGDEVLRTLASLLLQNTRDVDMVFRYGGEEFSIIIPEVSKQEAFTMAERIRRVVQDHVFPFEEEQPGGNLTVSMGIAGFPEDAEDSEQLIDNADRALYRAKLSGRNRVCVYDPRIDTRAFHAHMPETAGGFTS